MAQQAVASVGTHSLRVTLLSWCAKAGISLGHRRLLGQHIKAGACSVITYSRDALAQPLTELRQVVMKVRSGEFRPDETRSGRWYLDEPNPGGSASRPTWALVETDRAKAHCESADAEGASLASSSSDPGGVPECDTSDGEPERLVKGLQGDADSDDSDAVRASRRPSGQASEVIWRHATRGTFHCGHASNPMKLACGRAASVGQYELIENRPALFWPRCQQCFGSAEHQGSGVGAARSSAG